MKNGVFKKGVLGFVLAVAMTSAMALTYVTIVDGNGNVIDILRCNNGTCTSILK